MDVAVVTGAGRGLGREIARGLGQKGFRVLVTDVDRESAESTAEAIGETARAMRQDVRDPSSHRNVARAASERGRLTLWINNAGVLQAATSWTLDEEAIKRQVDVNFLGTVWGSRAAIEAMREAGGHIINIASLSAHAPSPGIAVYGATKHAVLGFSLSIQGELAMEGVPVQVSTVCPDAIDTSMVRDVQERSEADLIFSGGSLLKPEDVAQVVMRVVDRPRIMVTIPPSRGALAFALRPFPALGLRVLQLFRKVGEKNRLARIRGRTF